MQPLMTTGRFLVSRKHWNQLCLEAEVWEFLLECYTLRSTSEHRRQLRMARSPCNLTRPIWLSRISGLLETKTALDVAVFLQYFMIERNAKRIKVDQNETSTGNNRQENISDPSPSSLRLAGSFGPHAQDSTSSNQAVGDEIGQLLQPASAVFPLPVITEETTNAAPLDFRTNEELVNSVSSPTFDLDLPDLPFSPREILEDLAHLSFPPETAPGEPENPDLPSGSWL